MVTQVRFVFPRCVSFIIPGIKIKIRGWDIATGVLIIIVFLEKTRFVFISWEVCVLGGAGERGREVSDPSPRPPSKLRSRFLFPVLCSCSSGKTLWGFVYLFVLVLRRGRERETAEVGRDSCRLPKRGERG